MKKPILSDYRIALQGAVCLLLAGGFAQWSKYGWSVAFLVAGLLHTVYLYQRGRTLCRPRADQLRREINELEMKKVRVKRRQSLLDQLANY